MADQFGMNPLEMKVDEIVPLAANGHVPRATPADYTDLQPYAYRSRIREQRGFDPVYNGHDHARSSFLHQKRMLRRARNDSQRQPVWIKNFNRDRKGSIISERMKRIDFRKLSPL